MCACRNVFEMIVDFKLGQSFTQASRCPGRAIQLMDIPKANFESETFGHNPGDSRAGLFATMTAVCAGCAKVSHSCIESGATDSQRNGLVSHDLKRCVSTEVCNWCTPIQFRFIFA